MSLTSTVKQGSDLYFLYTFLKRLTTPFENSKAFELGIIDEKGKVLRKRSTLRTPEERASYTLMDTLIFNLKKLMAKIPFGSSKLMSYAASLFLLKEQKNYKLFLDEKLLEEKFTEFYTKKNETAQFIFESEATYNLFEELEFIDEKKVEEDAPANSVGGGNVAGLGVGPQGEPGVHPKRKKKKRTNQSIIDHRKFILTRAYKDYIQTYEEFDIITGIGQQVKEYYDVLPDTDFFIVNEKTDEEFNIREIAEKLSPFNRNFKKSYTANKQRTPTLGSIKMRARSMARKARTVRAIVGVRG